MNITFSLKNISEAANQVIESGKDFHVWTFTGQMGAGKTTLIKQICLQKGVKQVVSSPTFSIINEYKSEGGDKIYHLDLYRLKDEEEAIQAGVEDVLQSGNLCLVEWPQIANRLFPPETIDFYLQESGDDERSIGTTGY